MKRICLEHRCSVWPLALAAALLLVGSGSIAWAQADGAAVEGPAVGTNPAVRAAVELPRTEPSHYLSAINALVDLDRPELAVPILAELEGLNLNDAQLTELVDEFGTHVFVRLSRSEELAPAGQQFADAALTAAAAQARDPARLARLVDGLTDPAAEVHYAALVDLATTGEPGIIALLEALVQEQDPERREAFAQAVVRIGQEATGPLLGILAQQTNRNVYGADVNRILQTMQVSQAAPLIAAHTGSPDAERLLTEAIDRYRRGAPAFVADANDQVALWLWCKGNLHNHLYPADEAQIIWMARLALELAKLRPENREYQRQALLLALEAGFWVRSSGRPVGICDMAHFATQQLVEVADAAMMESVLSAAMEQNHPRAAMEAATWLGQNGTAGMIIRPDGRPAPLVDALRSANRRVRFAALAAIMQINPRTPFAGSSRVPQALVYFARSGGARQAVVAMPTSAMATDLAGQLRNQGIDGVATIYGREAAELAARLPDVELVLVDMDIQEPGVREVLYRLRITPPSADIPIGLLAATVRFDAAERLASEHTRVIAWPRPHSDASIANLTERLRAAAGRRTLTAAQRQQQAEQAVQWIATLVTDGPAFYDLHEAATVLENSLGDAAAEHAYAALVAAGTPRSQRALVDYASRMTAPIDARRAAADAFRQSVAAHGVLLTSDEILLQYDRYNASASADAQTQQVLGAVLDAIESLRDHDQGLSIAP